ncbi:cell division protein FtsZ [bacterium]|nr:cell division protein FtsZ [bacterium]
MQTPSKVSPEKAKKDKARGKTEVTNDFDKELEKLLRSHRTNIKVVGTGGAGNNTITRLMQIGIKGVETIAVNTDAQDLLFSHSDKKVLIGRNVTNGLGAGSDPQIGEESARENIEDLKAVLTNTDMVFVTCGLGGGTGTGSAPVIAEIARSLNALTISIVTLPFSEEGVLRWRNATYGLEKLKENSDTVIVIQNDKLWEIVPEMPLDSAFQVADDILVSAVKGITELVTEKGLINLDFADVRSVMYDGGTALIGIGESSSSDRAVEAVERAIANPLIELDITGAKAALMNIAGGTDMSVKDAKVAMQTLARRLDPSAKIIWGARVNPKLENTLRVMIIATGIKEKEGGTLQPVVKTETSVPALEISSENEFEINEEKQTPPTDEVETQPQTQAQAEIETAVGEEGEEKENAKKVFREIMEEEADADLKIISDAFDTLQNDLFNKEAWKELRACCASLAGTAQMFDFDDISEFMAAVEDFVTVVEKKDFCKLPQVLALIQDIPKVVRQMIRNDEEAKSRAAEQIVKFNHFRKYLDEQESLSEEEVLNKLEEIWTTVSKDTEEKENSFLDSSTIGKNTSSDEDNGRTFSFSSVSDAVSYVDNLFRGKIKLS